MKFTSLRPNSLEEGVVEDWNGKERMRRFRMDRGKMGWIGRMGMERGEVGNG